MSPDLDRKLCETYPLLFRYRDLPRSEHTMGRGFECGNGWYALIDAACVVVMRRYENEVLAYRAAVRAGEDVALIERSRLLLEAAERDVPAVLQVKEKLGSLRIYFDGGGERARAASEFAEHLSESVCELCGCGGKLSSDGGWMRTRCEEHEHD
jgi:hypothetical protein